MGQLITTVVIANGGTASAAFTMHPRYKNVGVIFPAMDNGAITMSVTNDGGTTWFPVMDLADGADLALVASGEEPCYVDISDYLRAIPVDPDPASDKYKVRFNCAAQSSGAVTLTVFFCDRGAC